MKDDPEGVASGWTDLSLEGRKQWDQNKYAEGLLLSGEEEKKKGKNTITSWWRTRTASIPAKVFTHKYTS